MELINGKFYQDGNEVPLEIGNREQIRLLKRQLEYLQGIEDEFGEIFTVEVEFSAELICTAEITAKFECECGKNISLREIKDDVDSHYDDYDAASDMGKNLLGIEKQCSCGKKYTFIENNQGIWAQRS